MISLLKMGIFQPAMLVYQREDEDHPFSKGSFFRVSGTRSVRGSSEMGILNVMLQYSDFIREDYMLPSQIVIITSQATFFTEKNHGKSPWNHLKQVQDYKDPREWTRMKSDFLNGTVTTVLRHGKDCLQDNFPDSFEIYHQDEQICAKRTRVELFFFRVKFVDVRQIAGTYCVTTSLYIGPVLVTPRSADIILSPNSTNHPKLHVGFSPYTENVWDRLLAMKAAGAS